LGSKSHRISSLVCSVRTQKSARTAQTVLAQLERAFHFSDRHIFVRH